MSGQTPAALKDSLRRMSRAYECVRGLYNRLVTASVAAGEPRGHGRLCEQEGDNRAAMGRTPQISAVRYAVAMAERVPHAHRQ